MAETGRFTDPGTLDGEPYEVALEAVRNLAGALREVAGLVEATEQQVRNARMTDALELPGSELAVSYPEAVQGDGCLRADRGRPSSGTASERPLDFYELTADAALITRIAGALGTIIRLVEELEEQQPVPDHSAPIPTTG